MISNDPVASRIRLGLRRQLIVAMSILAALLASVAFAALLSLWNIKSNTSQAIEIEGELNRLANNVVIYTQLCRIYEKDTFFNVSNPTVRDYNLLAWQGAYQNLDSAIVAFGRAAVTPQDRQQAETWHTELDHYRIAFGDVKQSVLDGDILTPEAAFNSFKLSNQDIQSLTSTALTMAQTKAVTAQLAETALLETTARSTWLVLGISALALVVAVAWCLVFPARLMRPIAALQTAATRLAGGDLAARVGLKRADELGLLGQRFDEMAATIQQRTSDLEAQQARANSARIEAETARAEIAGQLTTIDAQRNVIREMSVPVLPLSQSALVLPLVGALDSERLALVQEQALRSIEQLSARFLILDITGVPIVDTTVAHGLIQVMQAARLLGAEVVLVGIRPEVAQAVVGLGIHLNDIVTRSTLQSGIAYVLGRSKGTWMI
ncbi:MAG: STAS domain-containing protein [Roseiflexaceae bacterium]